MRFFLNDFKIDWFTSESIFYFIILFFLRGGGEKLALCNSNRRWNVCVLDLEQQPADDQCMTSKYCENDSKARGAIIII